MNLRRARVVPAASDIPAAERRRRTPRLRGRSNVTYFHQPAVKDKPTETDAALTAVTPIDGRYRARTRSLEAYFSEFALIRYGVRVEIEWYLSLSGHPAISALKPIPAATAKKLRAVYEDFALDDARRVKQLEATTNHDVKAVEYFVKERIAAINPALPIEMVHFACTSEDINNLAYALILKEFVETDLTPRLE